MTPSRTLSTPVWRSSRVAAAVLCVLSGWAQAHQPTPDKGGATPVAQQLEPVQVDGRSTQANMRRGALRQDIVQTETLSEKQIERSGATNINEALDKNPGIAVQLECSICNVRNVLLNNLPGRYTTLLIDGIPIYSAVSSAYGLDSVSVWGLERVDVARGAGASLIAPEALAGTVNIITKRPMKDENQLRLQLGGYGSRQADGYVARTLGANNDGALSLSFNLNRHDSIDGDGDGISEFSGFERRMVGLAGFARDLGGWRARTRLDVIKEDRGGGALGRDYQAIMADQSGNPFDFRKTRHGSPSREGWVVPADGSLLRYDGGRGGFSEIIFTDRVQWVGSAERPLGNGKLRLAAGAARHEQDSYYEHSRYAAAQDQYYAEISAQQDVAGWQLTSGLNYRFEDLASHGATADGTPVVGVDNYVYRTPALFVQGYKTFWDDHLELNASLRHDRHNVFGGITSPRVNALYHHTHELSSRLSLGRGFRAPTSFFEQDHGILDTVRIERQVTKPEISDNLSYALNYADERLAVTASAHHNRIRNFTMLDSGASDAQGRPITLFTAATQPVTVQGIDLNGSYLLTPALTLSAALERFRYRFTPGTLAFPRPTSRAYASMDWEQGAWDVTAKLVWTSAMDLRRFGQDADGRWNRYNFDGTPKRTRSPSYITLDVRGEYRFNPTLAVFAGADNLSNTRQVDTESQLFVDADGALDVVHLWGPNRGRYVYAGVKLSF
ncbi:TonB-dependent receptor plug domain-containing protein [Roseateles sp. BYS180W]|uniref:TonB-dependent receptor plug domain-containing protein n=1 Tax=Roseateles rivi TaxID=3299028 RepID=A0ABW7FWR4_9BURK